MQLTVENVAEEVAKRIGAELRPGAALAEKAPRLAMMIPHDALQNSTSVFGAALRLKERLLRATAEPLMICERIEHEHGVELIIGPIPA